MKRTNPLFVDNSAEQERIDNLIRTAYASPNRGKGELKRLQNLFQCSHHAIYKRALHLGIISGYLKKQPTWTEPEIKLLEENADKNPINISKMLVYRGFTKRTPLAIRIRINKIGLQQTEERMAAGIYSAQGAAIILGVSHHIVRRMISRGQLNAKRDPNNGCDRYHIAEADLRKLIANYPSEINYGRIDKYWLAEQIRK